MTFDRTAYLGMLRALLPPGALFEVEPGSVLSRLLEGAADELVRVGQRGADLINESDPRTATETLAEWERTLSLPDEYVTEIPATTEGRRVAVTQKLASRGGQNLEFFTLLCEACGYPLTSLESFNSLILRAGFRVGARVWGNEFAYAMRLNLGAAATGALPHADFERVIRRATHSHIQVLFTYA